MLLRAIAARSLRSLSPSVINQALPSLSLAATHGSSLIADAALKQHASPSEAHPFDLVGAVVGARVVLGLSLRSEGDVPPPLGWKLANSARQQTFVSSVSS
jgi:hypothetical protein